MSNNPISYKNHIEYEQGNEQADVQFALMCTNIPTGSRIRFSADTPGPVPSIDLPWTMVTTSSHFVAGVQCQVPAGYRTTITYEVEFSQQPPADARVEMRAMIPVVIASSAGGYVHV